MADKKERVGGHVGRKRAAKALGFEPEVGETFEAAGMRLRVLSRTIGLETGDDGEDEWFDLFFVATVEPVEDIEGTASRLRALFGLEAEAVADEADAEAGADDDAPVAESGEDAGGDDPADEGGGSAKPIRTLDEAVLRDLEDILEAA